MTVGRPTVEERIKNMREIELQTAIATTEDQNIIRFFNIYIRNKYMHQDLINFFARWFGAK
jgi:hypothetical protein